MNNRRKTNYYDRETYRYKGADGRMVEIKPNEEGVTAEWIHQLHLLDDQWIYHDNKNTHKRLNQKEIKMKREWEALHPGEVYERNYTLSLEGVQALGIELDKCQVMGQLSNLQYMAWLEREGLVEALDFLNENERELIELYYFSGYSQRELAIRFGISSVACHKRLKRALGKLKKFFQVGG